MSESLRISSTPSAVNQVKFTTTTSLSKVVQIYTKACLINIDFRVDSAIGSTSEGKLNFLNTDRLKVKVPSMLYLRSLICVIICYANYV